MSQIISENGKKKCLEKVVAICKKNINKTICKPMLLLLALYLLKTFADPGCVFHYYKADIYLNDGDRSKPIATVVQSAELPINLADIGDDKKREEMFALSSDSVDEEEGSSKVESPKSLLKKLKAGALDFINALKPRPRTERIKEEIVYLMELLIAENKWHMDAISTIDEVLKRIKASDMPDEYVLELFFNFIDEYSFEGKEEILKFVEKLAKNTSERYGKDEIIEAVRSALFEIMNKSENGNNEGVKDQTLNKKVSARSVRKIATLKNMFEGADRLFSSLS